MLSKVLITALVIIIAVIYLRKQRAKPRTSHPDDAGVDAGVAAGSSRNPWQTDARTRAGLPEASSASRVKTVSAIVLAGIITVGSVITWLHWQDQRRLVTVLLYRDADQAPAIYRVSKRNLGEGSFTTEEGVRVTVSANERIEIVGF